MSNVIDIKEFKPAPEESDWKVEISTISRRGHTIDLGFVRENPETCLALLIDSIDRDKAIELVNDLVESFGIDDSELLGFEHE